MNSLYDISSEDSNIVTYFQSFEKVTGILDPGKELSESFARFELLNNDHVDLDNPQTSDLLNRIYNLILSVILIVESYPGLWDDFNEYCYKTLGRFLTKISGEFKSLYHLTNDNIDNIWQIHRILKLIYEFELSEYGYKFPVSNEVHCVLIKCFLLPLFKYMKPEETSIDSGIAQPNEFFRGKIRKSYVVDQKIKLLDSTLSIILNNCDLSTDLLQYFHTLLYDFPTYFSYQVYTQYFVIIQARVDELAKVHSNLNIIKITNKIDSIITGIIVDSISKLPPDKYLLAHDLELGTIQIKESPKPPNWVNYFEFESTPTQQNSDYYRPVALPPHEISESELEIQIHRGFRYKFKSIFKFT